MMRRGWYLVAACVAALTITSSTAQAGGHVYALRGLINVFSYGMDEMVAKCKRRGIQASAHGHGEYPTLAIEAAAKVKSGKGPIIIIGHSYGADAAVSMAKEMKKARRSGRAARAVRTNGRSRCRSRPTCARW